MKKLVAVILAGGPSGEGRLVEMLADARLAAAIDLANILAGIESVFSVVVATPRLDEIASRIDLEKFVLRQTALGPIRVGEEILMAADSQGASAVLYFGGGSAPLLNAESITAIADSLASGRVDASTNNRHSSDWLGFGDIELLRRNASRFDGDNRMAPILAFELGVAVEEMMPGSASRMDIDTPSDLIILNRHPSTGPALRSYLDGLKLPTSNFDDALAVLATEGSRTFLWGRVGGEAWSCLSRKTHSWIRVLSEERGMIASGRVEDGEVNSIGLELVARMGPVAFFEWLAERVDVALIDTRVMMAARKLWPETEVRFATDLLLADDVPELWLAEFTSAAANARIPVLLGGQSLMSGGIFAICDLL